MRFLRIVALKWSEILKEANFLQGFVWKWFKESFLRNLFHLMGPEVHISVAPLVCFVAFLSFSLLLLVKSTSNDFNNLKGFSRQNKTYSSLHFSLLYLVSKETSSEVL